MDMPLRLTLCFGPAAAPRSSSPVCDNVSPVPHHGPAPLSSLHTPVLQAAAFEQTPIIYFLFKYPSSSCWDEA